MTRLSPLFRSSALLLTLVFAAAPLGACKDKANASEDADKDKKSEGDSAKDDKKSDKKDDKKGDGKAKSAHKTPDGVKVEFAKPSGSVSKITLTGMDAKGEVSCFGTTGCGVRLEKLPEGTKAKLGAAEATAEGKSQLKLEFDMGEQIGKASVEDALRYDKTVDPQLTLELTFPDGVKVSAALPGLTTKYFIEQTMEKDLINGKPVLFGKEAADPPKAHSILFLDALLDRDAVIGPAKTMSEIDLVAVKEPQEKRSGNKKCTGYKATGDKGPGTDADLMLVDWDVKIIERKTGKVVDSKKFEGEKRCPFVASNGEATSYPDRRAIQTWLRSKK
jgi:hypothetical protein